MQLKQASAHTTLTHTILQSVPFIVSLVTAVTSYRKPSSGGTSVTVAVLRATVREALCVAGW